MMNWDWQVMLCLGKTEWEEEEVESMKYSYRRKQITMRPYGAN